MAASLALILVSILQGLQLNTAQQGSVDPTRQREASGADVVRAVVDRIQAVFGDDKQFLRRIAFVESRDGTAPDTYRRGYDGGIWQVDERVFRHTQNTVEFMEKHQEIENSFDIDWLAVQWTDLRIPLYSGLAARLSLCVRPPPIPCTIIKQAIFWIKYYNTAYYDPIWNTYNYVQTGNHTIENFLQDAEILRQNEGM